MRSFVARQITLALTAITLTAGSAAAQTQVLGFEDVGSDAGCCHTLPDNYGGFTWGWAYNTIGKAAAFGSGYDHGTTGNRSIFVYYFGDGNSITSATLFNFIGADFAAAWDASQTVTLTGYRGGMLVGSTSATITNTEATFVTANFAEIDELRVSGSGQQINIDQFTTGEIGFATTTAPEPASIALMGTGLLAVGGLAARRKRA